MSQLVVLNAERLATEELCPRRRFWTEKYAQLRVSPLRALYMALDAGLRTAHDPEKAAESELLSLARSPGLDIVGGDVYAIAMHYTKLAGILALALRSLSDAPWRPVDPIPLSRGGTWHSALYDTGDEHPRRVVLVDRWTDDRAMEERMGWRTLGEVCALNRPVVLCGIVIGASHQGRRHSHWTLCRLAPHTNVVRFIRKMGSDGFSPSWRKVQREDLDIPTETWLTKMREDGCFRDLVHKVKVPVPANRPVYMAQMLRMARDMASHRALPPIRLAGCFGWSPCNFLKACHTPTTPESLGFVARSSLKTLISIIASPLGT